MRQEKAEYKQIKYLCVVFVSLVSKDIDYEYE